MQILETLVWLYSLVRRKANPVRMPNYKTKVWEEVRNLSLSQFSEWLDSFPYKKDRLNGLLDMTESFDHFVDLTVKQGRDCDDFARMWTYYGKYNGYIAREAIVARKKFPFKFHVVSILKKNGQFILCDYKNYGPFNSMKEVKKNLCDRWTSYTEDNLIMVDWIV